MQYFLFKLYRNVQNSSAFIHEFRRISFWIVRVFKKNCSLAILSQEDPFVWGIETSDVLRFKHAYSVFVSCMTPFLYQPSSQFYLHVTLPPIVPKSSLVRRLNQNRNWIRFKKKIEEAKIRLIWSKTWIDLARVKNLVVIY
jgi:hypothetical protein